MPPRLGHSAIYDPLRDRMVVFGGSEGNFTSPRNDVWSLALEGTLEWSLIQPAGTAPDVRAYQSAIYDPVRDRMVVFGGSKSYLIRYDDTWALSFSPVPQWSQLAPIGTPPSGGPTSQPGASIYDPIRDRMVIFTGSEVWALSLAGTPQWSQLSTEGSPPSSRFGHSAIYDPVRDRMVIFGGCCSGSYELNELSDVWALSLAGPPTWSEIFPSGSAPAMREHSAVYDSLRDRMVVFGGVRSDFFAENYLNEVWELSLAGTAAWTTAPRPETQAERNPIGRIFHSAVYDLKRDRMVVFGGYNGRDAETGRHPDPYIFFFSDVWVLGPLSTGDWTELVPAGTARWSKLPTTGTPPGEAGEPVYDPLRDRAVVFTGGETWALPLSGAATWFKLPTVGTPPSPRTGHSTIYDPVGDRLVVFGGREGVYEEIVVNDVWALSLGGTPVWSELILAGTPPNARWDHSAIYDPSSARMVIFGGDDATSPCSICAPTAQRMNDVWTLALGENPEWAQLFPLGDPPIGRSGHRAVHDPIRNRMVVAWGTPGYYRTIDTWALSLDDTPTWSRFDVGSELRFEHTAIYDPVWDAVIVFGGWHAVPCGACADIRPENDVWVLSMGQPTSYSQLLPALEPPSRGSHSALYDPIRDRMLVFEQGMVWALQWTEDLTTPTIVSNVIAAVEEDVVRVTWLTSEQSGVEWRLYRAGEDKGWEFVTTLASDGSGRIEYADKEVAPGQRYGYRLGMTSQQNAYFGEVWIEVPEWTMALLGSVPNPAVSGQLTVTFTLPSAEPAVMDVLDIAGRLIASESVGSMGPGRHTLRLVGHATVQPGIYFVTLSQGAQKRMAKAVVIR